MPETLSTADSSFSADSGSASSRSTISAPALAPSCVDRCNSPTMADLA